MSAQDFNAILLSLLGIAATVGAILFWRMFCRMEKKIDEWFEQHIKCRERQNLEFVKVKEFEEMKTDRKDRWDKHFFSHTHYPEEEGGGVKIPRPAG
jgi:hypothetical protein